MMKKSSKFKEKEIATKIEIQLDMIKLMVKIKMMIQKKKIIINWQRLKELWK